MEAVTCLADTDNFVPVYTVRCPRTPDIMNSEFETAFF